MGFEDSAQPTGYFVLAFMEGNLLQEISISYKELEALHDVLEAARCFWHPQESLHGKAAETLRLANRLYWLIGEYLPKTGEPSERFYPVHYSYNGNAVEKALASIVNITNEYSRKHYPWTADTVVVSDGMKAELSTDEIDALSQSLAKLGLTLMFDEEIPPDQVITGRRNIGPCI
ncbi:MAG TPA: hypothetical protein VG962_07110 [Steroidobacteraceae bacterium]|nr:hypothetical protein [Steroidobacteraceae bacterium]